MPSIDDHDDVAGHQFGRTVVELQSNDDLTHSYKCVPMVIIFLYTNQPDLNCPVSICVKVVHQLFLWPYLLSPMRFAPGPPLGHVIYGQWPEIIRNEAGVVQREWAKKYGPTVRAVGPVGVERITFLSPEAMQKVLSSDYINYPRVRTLTLFIS